MKAFLGLGSNLGERLANLQRAVELLAAHPRVRVLRSSRVFETDPIGPPQPDFLNAVIAVDTELSPRELLVACLGVEDSLGRVRAERWGPRTIDVDLLVFDGIEVDEPDLQVPHPLLHLRAFALLPLLELDEDPPLANGLRAADASPEGEVRLFAPPLEVPS